MNGCLKGAWRLGCLAVLAAAAAAGWWYRDDLHHAASRWFGRRTTLPAVDSTVGAPTPGALASAQQKLADLARSGGPDSVVLDANEMASLIGSGIDWSVRKSFDSLRVELHDGRFALDARLDTRVIPSGTLGPFSGLLQPHEPLRLGGTLSVARPGVASWKITAIALRGVPFPTALASQFGADTSGAVALKIAPAIADLAIHATGVTLYRHKRA